MNISLKIQKWSERSFIKISEVSETKNFLVIHMKDCTSLLIDDIKSIEKSLKDDEWNLYSIDYKPTEWTMEIWFNR